MLHIDRLQGKVSDFGRSWTLTEPYKNNRLASQKLSSFSTFESFAKSLCQYPEARFFQEATIDALSKITCIPLA